MKRAKTTWPIRKVLLDLYEVRDEASPGRYSESHLGVLSKSLKWAFEEFGLSKAQLGRDLLFSSNVLSSVMDGHSIRFANFLRLTNNLIAYLEARIENDPSMPPVFTGLRSDWRFLKSDATKKIARLSKELTELLDIVRSSNSLAMSDEVLAPELKAQLIALLETALVQLRAPIVETSLLTRIGRWLPKIGKMIGEKAGEKAIEKLASDAGEHMIDLIEGAVL